MEEEKIIAEPKLSKNVIIKTNVKKQETYYCEHCKKIKARNNFIKNWVSDINVNAGLIPYCKACIKELCNDEYEEMDISRAAMFLKIIDKPYRKKEWDYVLGVRGKRETHIFTYLKKLAVVGMRHLTWKDGDLNILRRDGIIPKTQEDYEKEKQEDEKTKKSTFEVKPEMVELFGSGFSDEEYKAMWLKYMFLKENYSEQTSMHTEALATYIRYKVKEEMAVARGDAMEAKTWGELAMKQADKAKINPYQFSKADLQGGLSTIGEIVQAVEQNQDIIPILPKFKYRPNDAVDFCIWNYINYARSLEGKPLVEYSDIYQFYDKQKENFIATTGDPYGIFEGDTSEHNREKIEKFIAPFEEEEEN